MGRLPISVLHRAAHRVACEHGDLHSAGHGSELEADRTLRSPAAVSNLDDRVTRPVLVDAGHYASRNAARPPRTVSFFPAPKLRHRMRGDFHSALRIRCRGDRNSLLLLQRGAALMAHPARRARAYRGD